MKMMCGVFFTTIIYHHRVIVYRCVSFGGCFLFTFKPPLTLSRDDPPDCNRSCLVCLWRADDYIFFCCALAQVGTPTNNTTIVNTARCGSRVCACRVLLFTYSLFYRTRRRNEAAHSHRLLFKLTVADWLSTLFVAI